MQTQIRLFLNELSNKGVHILSIYLDLFDPWWTVSFLDICSNF